MFGKTSAPTSSGIGEAEMRTKHSRMAQDQITNEIAIVNEEIQRLEQTHSRSEYQEITLQVLKNRRRWLSNL